MALTDDLLAVQVGHQIGLHRLATGLVQKIVALLNRTDADLVRRIERSQTEAGNWTAERIARLLEDVRRINVEAYRAIQRQLTGDLQDLAEYEVQYQMELFEHTVPVELNWRTPTLPQLRAAVNSRPFQGSLLREWVAGMEQGRARRLREAIRIGYVEGETVQQLVRRVRGTQAAGYSDGVLAVSRRSAETIVRTAVAHTATAAREVLYETNADLIKGVEWVSTLDLRTTPVCRARDGRVWPPGEGPRPPAHLNCRSTTVPVLKSWRDLGIDLEEAPPGTRASMNGQVAADLTYGEWLRRQSAAVQEDVLGVAKARLFRAGGLTMDRFVDSTGRAYTLAELRRREREAWDRAGLEAA